MNVEREGDMVSISLVAVLVVALVVLVIVIAMVAVLVFGPNRRSNNR